MNMIKQNETTQKAPAKPFLPFFSELDKRLAKGAITVAIEGGSGSGKTTLSHIISGTYDCAVFHMDDFFLRPEQRTPERYAEIGGNIDRERFLSEVLIPLSKGEIVNYRKFDCSTMSLEDIVQVPPRKLIVIEGVYAMHPQFQEYYDFSVFLDITAELQKERIMQRNSAQMAQRFFHEWIPLEQKYFTTLHIRERCDMQINIT